ncbi:GntR family transcriptional regulator [Marinitoga sp. 1135]|uniref:GntR family transcriptional regulator n=1 Tax=unclassified Marinitoga TaxID=2640159 RepID=UPI000950918B|nr:MULTISPECIES: GntR family transcriptional regulator [unclassified Marinitoga]APT76002.1 GntR family transcriptional regulator [Marinitoga sp. 1137]NUU95745.1 GntR family transcriptional regulator [Marinitoga sp. 1135]
MIPLYLKISNYLETLILKGKYLPGDKIPSENELAEEFNTTRMTVRKALSELEKKGIITKISGVGTFVTEINIVSRKKIGIVVQNTSIIYGIIKFCSKIGSKCFVIERPTTLEKEREALKQLLSMNIDGLIIEPATTTLANEILKDLLKEGFPVVFVDRNIDTGYNIPVILNDNYSGAKKLGEHMKKIHNTQNALYVISEDMYISSVNERFKGLSAGLNFEPEILKLHSIDGDYSQLKKYIKYTDTIFFCNDMMAVRGISTLLKLGIKIPEDIKVVGYDDDYVAHILSPKLTTVKQDLILIGETAASVIINLIKGEKTDKIHRIKSELIIRNSCGCKEAEDV